MNVAKENTGDNSDNVVRPTWLQELKRYHVDRLRIGPPEGGKNCYTSQERILMAPTNSEAMPSR